MQVLARPRCSHPRYFTEQKAFAMLGALAWQARTEQAVPAEPLLLRPRHIAKVEPSLHHLRQMVCSIIALVPTLWYIFVEAMHDFASPT